MPAFETDRDFSMHRNEEEEMELRMTVEESMEIRASCPLK
jgi:hypothetical protein